MSEIHLVRHDAGPISEADREAVRRAWRENLVGREFGRLRVTAEAEANGSQRRWLCACSCGNRKSVLQTALKSGATRSCGCLRAEVAAARSRTHNLSSTRTYRIWAGMLSRCNTPSASGYERYGAVGIRVCDRWRSFDAFLADMGECPAGLEIDRIKNELGYEPGNCRWATRVEQMQNRSMARWIEFDGETLSLTQWAERIGIHTSSLIERLQKWPLSRALTEPRRA